MAWRFCRADCRAPVRFATVSLLSPRTGGWTTTTDAAVLVGADGSPAAFRAVAWGAHEAALRGRRLELLYVNTWPAFMTANWRPCFVHRSGCGSGSRSQMVLMMSWGGIPWRRSSSACGP